MDKVLKKKFYYIYVFTPVMLKRSKMNKRKAKIIAKIIQCKNEADNLKPNIEKCESIRTLYNKKLIEKAVLTKELKEFENNFIIKLVRNFAQKNERTIEDYFVKS